VIHPSKREARCGTIKIRTERVGLLDQNSIDFHPVTDRPVNCTSPGPDLQPDLDGSSGCGGSISHRQASPSISRNDSFRSTTDQDVHTACTERQRRTETLRHIGPHVKRPCIDLAYLDGPVTLRKGARRCTSARTPRLPTYP